MSAWNAKISRVDQPEPGLLSLSFRDEGQNETLVLVTLPSALGAAVVERRPRGAIASPSVSQLRRHLEGARVEALEMSRRAIKLSLRRGEQSRSLIATASKPYGAWWLCADDGSIVLRSPGAPAEAPDEAGHLEPRLKTALRSEATTVLEAHTSARRRQLERQLAREIKRLSKKREAIAADLERADRADELHEKASLLLAYSAEIPDKSGHFDATTWDAEPRQVRIELDPTKSPTELAQELFARAKKMKRGLNMAPERLALVDAELAKLTRLRTELDADTPQELAAKLEAHGVRITAPKEQARKRRQAGTRLPYREFVTRDGATVLVGRGAGDNDRLTLRVARPHDLWLHARGVTGAHVVVPLDKGKSCTSESLVDAATLAAHFSDLRGEPVVDVIYTPRRFVHKRKGSAVGSVTLEREKVIVVRVEPQRTKHLLENEKKVSAGAS